ncbi:ABC transporter substrate-binding protein [Trichocoleus sp. AS-A1]
MAELNTQGKWICDGVPKNNNQQYPSNEAHPSQENHGPDCIVCGLPREAMSPQKSQKTVISKPPGSKPSFLLPILILLGILAALAGGFGLYKLTQGNKQPAIVASPETQSPTASDNAPTETADPQAIASDTADNAELISQGEKILLKDATSSQKTAAAVAFAQKNWEDAIAQYQQAVSVNPNDPESKIYLNNAKAKKAGNPLTMAVVVPITPSPDTAKEVLRGVGQAQDEFNQSPATPGRLLEVVIVNDVDPVKAVSLAQDLTKSPNILGVLGHGVDNGSQQAIAMYEQAGLTVLSPISTSITPGSGGQSTLQTIPLAKKANELLGTYLQTVGTTLAKYTAAKSSAPSVVVFYNADSPYSQQLKQQFTTALSKVNGKVVKEVDVTGANFNAATEIQNATGAGAKIGFLALSKNKVDQAIAIAKANPTGTQGLQLIGGDELYNPTILTSGGDAIKGIVLAVPWSSQPNDPFANQAATIWKGRVSWRTATAYDATKALTSAFSQNPSRSGVSQLLNQGVPISGTATDFNVLNEVPLVQAAPGSNGPPGSKYEFNPI